MQLAAKPLVLLLLSAGGATAIKKYGLASNVLDDLYFSYDTMFEKVVDPKDIEPYHKEKINWEKNSFGKVLSEDIPRLLNTDNRDHGWKAVLQVYKKTLEGFTVEDLMYSCKSIFSINHRLTNVEKMNNTRIVKKFCTYPIKVREKLGKEVIEKYSKWSNPSRIDRLNKRLEQNPPTINYCTWFPNTYTVYGEITLDEIDYINLCHPK